MMHPDTLALLQAAIRAEVQGDPAKRGYGGKSAAEIANLLNAPVVAQPAATHRDVSISDVEGYLRARLLVTRLRTWEATAEEGTPKMAALELLDIIASPRLATFTTSTDSGRANVLGLFGLLAQAGAGGITMQNLADLTAMTLAPAGPATVHAPRWSHVIAGIGGVTEEQVEYPGPPNVADDALVAEALA